MTDALPLGVSAIVLAAGGGTRMRSSRPKPLHFVCGRPMVMHIIHAIAPLNPERTVVVVGVGADQVTRKVSEQAPGTAKVVFVEQVEQHGTGHAAMIGLTGFPETEPGVDLDDTSTVIIVPGDTPLLRTETLELLVATHTAAGNAATMLTAVMDEPYGYGRVIRAKDGRVVRIIEERDASDEERRITEVSVGMYAFRRNVLGPALRHLKPDNAQSEYYLTDVVGVLAGMGHRVGAHVVDDAGETQGVNDRWQLALAERELRARTNKRWLLNGVTMLDPRQTFIDVTVTLGRDVTLFPGTMLQGDTVVGDGSEIGPDTRLVDCVVGSDVRIENSVAREATIGDGAQVGPYASLSPGTSVIAGAVTGAFYTGRAD